MKYLDPQAIGDECRHFQGVLADAPGAFIDRWRAAKGYIAQGYAGSLEIQEREAGRVLVEHFPEFGPQLERERVRT